MISGGRGTRAELVEFAETWAVTIYFGDSFTTYLIPVDKFTIADTIDEKSLTAIVKAKKAKKGK